MAVAGDVGHPADVQRMIDEVVKGFGRLDILVNNAGTQTWTPFLEVTEREWDLVIRTNLKGCFLCTQAAARQMRNTGGGAIVNIGSGCNKVPFPGLVAYTASKGGIEMLTKVAAVELARTASGSTAWRPVQSKSSGPGWNSTTTPERGAPSRRSAASASQGMSRGRCGFSRATTARS